ncbi:A disintegrin and metalloproteinase with thrombospondin motifs 20-like [Aphidius gifuensis]|uniref:A disintegrin and metalloproteinase with thrombospondin motifs 20-like n=1 Tax=Aphidius gifuensis TaxID=684658 RepID=UPI001CDC30E3|nr:A disintegrin and metalloproteinase with thrombospondin motifs 20-like [Aphidius gifuensis]
MEKNFCQWQSTQRNNPQMRNLNNSHVALLLTRHHICLSPDGNKHCNAIGMAHLGTICNPDLSCTVVNDGPYSTAPIIAHELGHLLGMDHDSHNNPCLKNDNNGSLHLMNYQATNIHPLMWSNCSDEYVTRFLESGGGDCLLAEPTEKFDETRYRHLGQQYSLNKTCEIAWGPGYYTNKLKDDEKCGKFRCYHKNEEMANIASHRWLTVSDGTTCGDNKICYEGECISANKMTPVNGGWSDYGDFGECSRTCGGGIKIRYRYCNNPTPMYGGQYCLGKKKDYEICASNKCPGGSQNFRDSQCAEFNNKNLSSVGIQSISANWKSDEAADDFCVLYCKNENKDSHYLQNRVIDGTPCRGEDFHMCVHGVCKKYGCDYKLNSTTEFDICGVCNGNNSTCHKITKSFTFTPTPEHQNLPSYHHVYTIPAGSHHIDIKQYTANSSDRYNYIALKIAKNGSYILNDDKGGIKRYSQVYESNGINIEYSVINDAYMRVNIIKPIVDDIVVEVLFTYEFVLTQTSLEFYIPSRSNRHDYRWKIGEWSRCNATCQGIKKRDVKCQRIEDSEIVADSFCKTKPAKSSMECNSNCVLRWDIENKTACSAKCGHGTRNINYNCVRDFIQGTISTVEQLNPTSCSHIEKPIESEGCYTKCSANWKYSNWGDCNVTCGGGVRIRRAQCVDNTGKELNENMCNLKKDLIESCGLNECPKWVTGPWSACSVSLDKGEKERQVTCKIGNKIVNNSYCEGSMPDNKKTCNKRSSTDPNKKKVVSNDRALKLIERMDLVINDLRSQYSNIKKFFEKDEGPLQDKPNKEIENLFEKFQTFLKSNKIQRAINKICINKIVAQVEEYRFNADNSIGICSVMRSKTLMSIVKEIKSSADHAIAESYHKSNLQNKCIENTIGISKKYCDSEMSSVIKLIKMLEASANTLKDRTMKSSITTGASCYDEPVQLFNRLVQNSYSSAVSCL